MELSLTYRALASGEVDVIAGDMTSAQITTLDLKVLSDDRGYFPPYDAIPIARAAVLLRHPEIRSALAALEGQVTPERMRAMNHAVDVVRRDPASVVQEFLAARSAGDDSIGFGQGWTVAEVLSDPAWEVPGTGR